jgi:hypothetical protein
MISFAGKAAWDRGPAQIKTDKLLKRYQKKIKKMLTSQKDDIIINTYKTYKINRILKKGCHSYDKHNVFCKG